MIIKNITKLPKGLVEVEITVPWADVVPIWETTLQKLTADLELPGFRKGQVPPVMAEQNLGTKVQDEVLKVAMPQFLIQALQGSDVIPIDYPKYQPTPFIKGQDLKYKTAVTNRPTVIIGDYKTIKVIRPVGKTVTEVDVDKVINDLFKRWQTRMSVGQPAPTQSGPVGQPNQNGGSAGSININGTQGNRTTSAPVVPTSPDDNFAKAVGGNDLADLKNKIKTDLEATAKNETEMDFEEAILQEVEKITTVDLPEILIGDELNRMLVSLQRRVADMGLLMDDYLKGQNKTLDQLKVDWRAQAEKNVRMELGLAEIARAEKVDISEQELQAEIDKIQDPRVKQQFAAPEPRLQLRHALRQTKTLDLLKKMV
ncbi:MAG: trigger factor [Candidatus Daviesbacteria bacterium]|nr:MAG: trigger factor [Candidatus Daviesbacteria bacterium]